MASKHQDEQALPASLRRILDQIAAWVERNPKTAEAIFWYFQHGTAPALPGEPQLSFVERVSRCMIPLNWLELGVGSHRRVRKVMLETGICLIWVPRPEIVKKLIAPMSKAERDEVLLADEETILADVSECVFAVGHPRLDDLRQSGEEAIAAYRDGHRRAAQALSAALLGAVLTDHFGYQKFDEARRAFESDHPEQVDPRANRIASIQWSIREAIRSSYDWPPPEGFNRHLSAHAVDSDQYTDANALSALMLVAGALRELQEIYAATDRGLPPVPMAAPPAALKPAMTSSSAVLSR
jgi:hypothetical protein